MHIAKVVMKSSYINLEELAKKYGYAHAENISQYIYIYENRDVIAKFCTGTNPISFKKAMKILRELKQKEQNLRLHSIL